MALVTTEVIDAVQRSLEKEGLLQSIRAQLRANVMKILTADPARSVVQPNVRFAETQNGRFTLCLVKDLLLHLNFKQSLAVFDAESNVENFYEDEFDGMCSKLKIEGSKKSSLLEQLVDDRINQKPIFSSESSSKNQLPRQARKVLEEQNQPQHSPSPKESPSSSAKQSPLQSPHVSPLTVNRKQLEAESKKSAEHYEAGAKDDSEVKSVYYGIKDNLEDLIEALSPQKDDDIGRGAFSDEQSARYLESKQSTVKRDSADDSMLDEIDEIIDSFEAEKEEEDDYDFDIAAPANTSPKTFGHHQLESKPVQKPSYLNQDSSDDDADLPPYGYVSQAQRAAPIPEQKTLQPLPDIKALGGRLPFNAMDFIDQDQSFDDDHEQDVTSPRHDNESKRSEAIVGNNKNLDHKMHGEDQDVDEDEDVPEDFGPEYDSEEQDDGDFSQLDNATMDALPGLSDSKSNVVQVQSSFRNPEAAEARTQALFGRADVSKNQGASMRSTKGWDVRDEDRPFEDDEDYDQLSSSPVAKIPVPGRRIESKQDDLESSQLSLEDQINISTEHGDIVQHDDDNVMHTSYRSNQDEDSEVLINHDDEEEKLHSPEEDYEEEYDNEFVDPEQSILENPTAKAFTKVQNVLSSNNQPEDDPDENDYGDDYGEDGFEDDDVDQNKSRDRIISQPKVTNNINNRYADDDEESVDEEIASEIEDEQDETASHGDGMSIGGQSESDDDQGWGKAKPSTAPTASSMFKQRSGVLPTVNNLNSGSRPNVSSSLNNFSDDDDSDDGLGAFSVSNRASVSQPNNNNRLNAGVNQRSNISNSRTYGGGSEENSVASENLSVGGDNSGEESFSMND